MRKRVLLKPVLAAVDISLLTGAFLLAFWLRFSFSFFPERPEPSFELYFRFSFLVGLIGFAMLGVLLSSALRSVKGVDGQILGAVSPDVLDSQEK